MNAQETARAIASGVVQAVKKIVCFNVTEVFQLGKALKCLMFTQGKYADLPGDDDNRRIYRIARLTGCTKRLNMSTIRRNKHAEMCFMVTVEDNRGSDLQRFKKLVC